VAIPVIEHVTLSAEDVGSYAYKAGVTDVYDLAVAIAVSNLESGFRPNAHAFDSDDDSYGLWQINMRGSMGPERRAKFGLANNEALFDPATNARVMAALSSNGHNFSAWSTFTSGPAKVKALQYMGTAGKIAASGGTLGGVAGAAAATAGTLEDIGTATKATYNWVSDRNNWFRVMKVVAGAALLVGGLYLVTRPIVGEQVEKVVGAASKVASVMPQGKAAKVATATKG
jgi:hypothetical protein